MKNVITTLLFDCSRTLLFPLDEKYSGGLNSLHLELGKNGDYDFWKHFRLNDELLEGLNTFHTDYQMFVFTTESIQDTPTCREKLDKVFDGIYSAQSLSLDKKNSEAYNFLARKMGVDCDEVLFIDDQPANIAAAEQAGMKTLLFTSTNEVFRVLDEYKD
jgi:FMN phosphatase YigB (HAD superfamily)